VNAFFERFGKNPEWIIAAAYVVFAMLCGEIIRRATKRWLSDVAAREKNEVSEILSSSLPRPIGAAVFLAAIAVGMRWFSLSEKISIEARRILPFCVGILIALTAMRTTFRAIDAYGRSNPALKSAAGIGRGLTWVIGLALVAVLASDAIGISLAPALTALGVGSLAVALALQDTLSNFFAGIHLVVDKPLRLGEFVRLDGGQEGYVEAIGWRSTRLQTMAGSIVIVPNVTLAKSVLINFRDQNPRLFVDTRIDVAIDSDIEKVLSIVENETKTFGDLAGADKDCVPYVRLAPGITDTSLAVTVTLKIKEGIDAGAMQDAVRRRVFARLRREQIAAPTPIIRRAKSD
jgi:small-conductance mechanosensitive channel